MTRLAHRFYRDDAGADALARQLRAVPADPALVAESARLSVAARRRAA